MNQNAIFLNINHTNKYLIHKNGFILNLSTGYIHSTNLKNNYLSITTKKFKLDKLIFCTFNNLEYTKHLYLQHIDGNDLNNDLYNLKLLEKTKYMQEVKYKPKIYNPLNYIILYKKYNLSFNLLDVYTNHKYIKEYTKSKKNLFIYTLLNDKILVDNDFIWEITIITIDKMNSENYINIPNTDYKISLDNTHILDKNNNILKYKLDKYDMQCIEIKDKNLLNIKIYYEYIEKIKNNELFKEFTNLLKDDLSLEYIKKIYDNELIKEYDLLKDYQIDLDLNSILMNY